MWNRHIHNILEINIECPKEIQDIVDRKLSEIMVDAARPFLKHLVLDSDAEISDHWVH